MPVPCADRHAIARALAAAALLCLGVARATTYVVTANDDMTFTPSDLTIYQHDQVTFMNAGGLHNVHADNDSFVCGDDCSLHTGPSSNPWQDTLKFNTLGSFGYYCDQHGDLSTGMRGSISVIDRVFVEGFDGP
jgi:plastocyanin